MITIKEATTKAVALLKEVTGSQLTANMMVEEVERDELNNNWIITLGYDLPVRENEFDLFGTPTGHRRAYKVFTVNAQSGEVVSMKIREVAAVE